MKKVSIIFISCCFLFPYQVFAKQEVVTFSKCVDGDTIKVKKEGKEYTVRFLAVDTPETVKKNADIEPYGKEASNYTCDRVTNAKKIVLEYDPKSSETDKYGRVLAWVYTDGDMLQEKLIEQGYAEVAYLYGNYLYTDELQELEREAKKNKKGMWSLTEEERNGCIIDDQIKEKSSGLCKDTSTKTEKKEKQEKNEKNVWSMLADFFIEILFDSIKQAFNNLF